MDYGMESRPAVKAIPARHCKVPLAVAFSLHGGSVGLFRPS